MRNFSFKTMDDPGFLGGDAAVTGDSSGTFNVLRDIASTYMPPAPDPAPTFAPTFTLPRPSYVAPESQPATAFIDPTPAAPPSIFNPAPAPAPAPFTPAPAPEPFTPAPVAAPAPAPAPVPAAPASSAPAPAPIPTQAPAPVPSAGAPAPAVTPRPRPQFTMPNLQANRGGRFANFLSSNPNLATGSAADLISAFQSWTGGGGMAQPQAQNTGIVPPNMGGRPSHSMTPTAAQAGSNYYQRYYNTHGYYPGQGG